MGNSLKALIVEDREYDAELLVRALAQAGFDLEWRRVDEEPAYRAALDGEVDIIFSDYSLPRFSTRRALEILLESRKDVPFIVVSGTIGEERAVDILKAGATDYVLKDRIERLGVVVERAQREVALRLEKARMEEVFRLQAAALENAANAVVITDRAGNILWVNPAFTELTGYYADEAIGQNPRILKSGKHDAAFYKELWSTILQGRTWRGEFTNRRKDGTLYYGEQTIAPVWTGTGVIGHFVGIMKDVTEKKHMEHQLQRAQRLESIGTLAAGIAHDLNNALAPIVMSLEVLKAQNSDPESVSIIELLFTSAQRGSEMVKQLLTFSRGMEGGPALLQVKHLLREVQSIVRRTFPKNIRLNSHIPKDLWPVLGDSTQLHQLILNLCVNARDAMPEGGELKLAASNIFVDEHFAAMSDAAKQGPHLTVSIGDTGSGMTKDVIDRIFDPFFTTKSPDKGTGLGLSIVQGIVRSHGGFIQVLSDVGKGSEFRVYLPARPEDIPDSKPPEQQNLPIGNGEGILVVDDEEAVRVLSKKTLEAFGYSVFTAGDGAQAVACAARETRKIKLVLMDLAMPIMDGPAAIRAIRVLHPEVKIIICSGMNENNRGGPAVSGADAFLPKPFAAKDLLSAVRDVLDSGLRR